MPSEIVTLVDSNDQVIGEAPRSEVRRKGLLHRVTYILVISTDGKLLLQKRTPIKDLYPGFFDAAAGGVVKSGEAYEISAIRELEEELGVSNAPLTFHFDHYFDDGFNRCWGRVFSCQHDGPFKLQAAEVESAKFVDLEPILDYEFKPITPDTFEVLQKWVESNRS
jgi:8-oxo-dGTP pyrophosphatase MutT (NUDIX family)